MDPGTVTYVINIRVALLSGIFSNSFWLSLCQAKLYFPPLYMFMLLLIWMQWKKVGFDPVMCCGRKSLLYSKVLSSLTKKNLRSLSLSSHYACALLVIHTLMVRVTGYRNEKGLTFPYFIPFFFTFPIFYPFSVYPSILIRYRYTLLVFPPSLSSSVYSPVSSLLFSLLSLLQSTCIC